MTFINLFWLVFSVFLWGFIHSLTASHPFKASIRRLYGTKADRYYRAAYNVVAAISFMVVLLIAALTPDRTLYVIPFPWVMLSIIIEILAVAVLVAGLLETDPLDFLGVRQIAAGKKRQSSKLVKEGLYQYVRHPLYSAGVVFIWALPLMTARVLVLDLALTVYVVVGAYLEERKLRQKFGPEYVEYAASTPMFIPFLRRSPGRSSTDGSRGGV